ncbi:MAG TPA: hypothetical protein VGR56_03220 [Nitrososphaerales archaeon]|nr:hypothetical protein [Nitrososphaerales archaeon]
MKEAEDVRIPMDYLISTHVLLSKSYQKLSEILGASAAMTFFSLASDYEPFGPMSKDKMDTDNLKTMLTSFGYSLKEEKKADSVEYRLWCPHAAKIHPELGEDASFCPMSQMVLGTVRKEHPKSIVTFSGLHDDGSSFTIKVQD